MNKGFIYLIRNKKTNGVYVGATIKSLEKRLSDHIYLLKSGFHWNQKLIDDYKEYGEKSFTIELIEEVENFGDISEIEQYWIDKLSNDSRYLLYNNGKKSGYKKVRIEKYTKRQKVV